MAGFSSYQDIVDAIAAGDSFSAVYHKGTASSSAGTRWWRTHTIGSFPAAGTNPAAAPGEQYTNAAGTINFPDRAGTKKHLVSLSGKVINTSTPTVTREVLVIYDRLAGVGGISLTTATNVVLNSVTVPRYTNGIGVECWLEVTAVMTGAATVNLSSYTSDTGAGRIGESETITSGSAFDSTYILPLQAGDKGVKSIESLNISAAATAGTAALVLMRPIATLPITQFYTNYQEFVLRLAALPEIFDGASLAIHYFGTHRDSIHAGNLMVAYG